MQKRDVWRRTSVERSLPATGDWMLLYGPGLIPGKEGCFPLATISVLCSLLSTEYRWLSAARWPQRRCDHTAVCIVSRVPFTVRCFEVIRIFDVTVIVSLRPVNTHRGADKSFARPSSRCIFFVVRIFRLMLVLFYTYIYIYIYI
jgi:hypothetical protein